MNRSPPPVVTYLVYDQGGSNKCTIVTSNAGHSECASNLISDEGTVTTHFSTDVKNENKVANAETEIPAGIFISQQV